VQFFAGLLLVILVTSSRQQGSPSPKNSSTMVYNAKSNTIKTAGLGGSDIQYDKNGLIKNKPVYRNPKAR
jgi:hypothetical protein